MVGFVYQVVSGGSSPASCVHTKSLGKRQVRKLWVKPHSTAAEYKRVIITSPVLQELRTLLGDQISISNSRDSHNGMAYQLHLTCTGNLLCARQCIWQMCRGLGLSALFLWYSWGRWVCMQWGDSRGRPSRSEQRVPAGKQREITTVASFPQVKQTNTGQQWKQRTLQYMLKSRNQV